MSDISFNDVPSDVRTPLAMIEFDNSNAVTGTPAPRQRVLMLGQRCSAVNNVQTGSEASNVPVRIRSASQATGAFGQGSMLARMAETFLDANRTAELWCIAQDDGEGSSDAATVTLSGTATATGVLVTYIAGQRLTVKVYADDTGTDIADALIEKINSTSSLPVTAKVVVNDTSESSAEDGETGSTDTTQASILLSAKFISRLSIVDVRWNYYSQESLPAGIVASVSYPDGTNTNPDIASSVAGMGDLQYKYIVMPYLDEPNLNVLRSELQERWGPVSQADGFAVAVMDGTLGNITDFGVSRNDHLIACMGVYNAPEPSWIWAASLCAIASQALTTDPARPLQTLVLTDRMPPDTADRFTWSERNALLYDGIATFTVNDSDQVQIERLITMYRTNSFGDTDPSYLDVNTIATLSYLRYSLRTRITQKFPRHKLADDGTNFSSGQAVVTPSVIKAELLALFQEWESAGLVEDFDTFSDELYVTRNSSDKNRLDVQCGPNLINQFRIFAAQIQFIL